MTELIRRAHARAVRNRATGYGWATYARLVLADAIPDAGSCGGHYLSVTPTGAVERHTYDPSVQNADGTYGQWRVNGTATVDASGSVIATNGG